MASFDFSNVIDAAWLIFFAYWLIAAFQTNRAKKREPAHERLLRFILMAVAFVLLYKPIREFPVLHRRFIPYVWWVEALGALLTCLGVAIAVWARYHIGRYWSSTVSLRADHQLIRSGPYSRVRHPIYTGILLALAGTVLAIGRYRAILALVILIVALTRKARREEALLSTEFGPAFEEHKRLTGFYFPR